MNREAGTGTNAAGKESVAGGREQDALYQNGKLVARVAEVEWDLDAKEVRFGEVYNSDHLMLPEECEFQDYRLIIQRIAYASKVERGSEHKGRVLRGSVAEILGHRLQ